MPMYEVRGPFEIDKKLIEDGKNKLPEFWKSWEVKRYADKIGIYVFGLRSGRSILPCYVGKTKARFSGEVFTDRNLLKYLRAMKTYKRFTPVLFLVVRPTTKGKVAKNELREVEQNLIALGVVRNPDIQNIASKPSVPTWSIGGVVRPGMGKPSGAAKKFKKMMGVE